MCSKIYRFTLKAPLAFSIILFFLLSGSLGELILWGRLKAQRRFFARLTSVCCGLLLNVLGVRKTLSGQLSSTNKSGRLFLSNHLSYLDILLISSSFPALFITSKEVEKTFFLGRMSRLGGSFFIERRTPAKLLSEIERIKDAIREGFDIVLFPEGTSGNGDAVLPFKKSLLATATGTSSPIQPLCIRYRKINGKEITPENRDLVYWYGDMTFFRSFFQLLFKTDRLDVKLILLPELSAQRDISESESRKVIAKEAYEAISGAYGG